MAVIPLSLYSSTAEKCHYVRIFGPGSVCVLAVDESSDQRSEIWRRVGEREEERLHSLDAQQHINTRTHTLNHIRTIADVAYRLWGTSNGNRFH